MPKAEKPGEMLVQSDDEVDIDAQVEAAKKLLESINKNNRS